MSDSGFQSDTLQDRGKLSPSQRAFVDAFEGNGVLAVLSAGYKCMTEGSARKRACVLLSNPKIQRAIAEKVARIESDFDKVREEHHCRVKELAKIKKEIAEMDSEILKGHIASRKERQVFWTQTMLDEKQEMSTRLRASELLGKSFGDFVERKELGFKSEGFAVIATPEVRMMIEEITGTIIPVQRRAIPETVKINPETTDIEVNIDLSPPEEEKTEPEPGELVDWVQRIQNEESIGSSRAV